MFDSSVNSSKNIWKSINKLCTNRKCNKSSVERISNNRLNIDNPSDICNCFNDYFCQVGDELCKRLHSPSCTHFMKYLGVSNSRSFYFLRLQLVKYLILLTVLNLPNVLLMIQYPQYW